jgi:hypothetical protein
MKVTLGARAHSGWAALVVLGSREGAIAVVDRRRVELADEDWARQPYHAAEKLESGTARDLVQRGIASAHQIAARELRAAVDREHERGNEVDACAILVNDRLPNWSIDEILAVHFRMHKAEGVLFRDALVRATRECGLRLVAIPEKKLTEHAESVLGRAINAVEREIVVLGTSMGPPWGRDQKAAALAALIAMSSR